MADAARHIELEPNQYRVYLGKIIGIDRKGQGAIGGAKRKGLSV